MKSTPLQRQQQGFSLIELMIAITLSLVLTAGVIQIFSSSKQTNRTQSALGNLQESARFALDLLSYDLRLAGNIGCNRAAKVNNLATDANLPGIGSGIQGYEYSGLPAVLINGSSKNPGSSDVASGTDAIVVRYASPNTMAVTGSSTNSVTFTAESAISKGDPLIVSDCQSADIFVADTGISQNSSGTISLPNPKIFSKTYGSDAEVAPLKYMAYYISQDSSTKLNNLYVSMVNGVRGNLDVQSARPLLEGVDDLQILYGQDLNGDGSNIRYVPAGTANLDMSQVTSVRLSLLFSTLDNNLASGDQNYWLNGELTTVTNSGNSSKKLYRGFTTAIKLRNQGIGL